jgi:ketosteroid isomerase-like protein
MTDKNIEIVKSLFDACAKKDFDTVRLLVHPDYTLKDPMMEIRGVEGLIKMMETCPAGRVENADFMASDDKVVSVFDAVTTEPVNSRLRMCSIITMENGRARAEEMLYDTAKVPKEIKELMEKSAPGKKKAA